MPKQERLATLLIALIVLLVIGRWVTGSFGFLTQDFWFTSGLLLLVLLSLVDQPHFSKDANVFVNAATGWMALLLLDPIYRTTVWWLFFAWVVYLAITSYGLMWVRRQELAKEPRGIRILSRLNREIGRPEALFSAFFLYGVLSTFHEGSTAFLALLLFWAGFMIINIPAVSRVLAEAVAPDPSGANPALGTVSTFISPRLADIHVSHAPIPDLAGARVRLSGRGNGVAADGVIIEDRVLAGHRIARVAMTAFERGWHEISGSDGRITVEIVAQEARADGSELTDPDPIVGVVEPGTDINRLTCHVHPDADLSEGEVLMVRMADGTSSYYQIVAGKVTESSASDSNRLHGVHVTATQLGSWNQAQCRFEPLLWVPPPGALVRRVTAIAHTDVPAARVLVGKVPNSEFPIHVDLQDTVTHNSAILGVTGSGKSYLAFHLIEALVASGIKVLVLDITRQHFVFLRALAPVPLRTAGEVAGWLTGDRPLGIYQFANANSYPRATAEYCAAVFQHLEASVQLRAGENEPARICVVFEEAHSLVPEWNQVAEKADTDYVNRTARTILQGRKYGLGCLLISQRTANVTKTILNQCNTVYALQSFDQTGLDFLRNYMGEEYARTISTLPARHAVLVGKASNSSRPILFEIADLSTRWREDPGEDDAAEQDGQVVQEA